MSTVGTAAITAATSFTGPVGAAASIVASLVPGVGPKFRKDNHVQRFTDAVSSGNTALARQLIDQAVYHAFAQQGIPDVADWRNILAAMYDAAPTMRPDIDSAVARVQETTPIVLPDHKMVDQTAPAPQSIRDTIAEMLGQLGQPKASSEVTPQVAGFHMSVGVVAAIVLAGVVIFSMVRAR